MQSLGTAQCRRRIQLGGFCCAAPQPPPCWPLTIPEGQGSLSREERSLSSLSRAVTPPCCSPWGFALLSDCLSRQQWVLFLQGAQPAGCSWEWPSAPALLSPFVPCLWKDRTGRTAMASRVTNESGLAVTASFMDDKIWRTGFSLLMKNCARFFFYCCSSIINIDSYRLPAPLSSSC